MGKNKKRRKGKGRYRLKRGDGKDLKKLYNGILLKEYIEPSEPSPSKPPGLSQTKPSPDKPNPEEKPSPDNNSNSDGEIGGPPPKKRKVHKGYSYMIFQLILITLFIKSCRCLPPMPMTVLNNYHHPCQH